MAILAATVTFLLVRHGQTDWNEQGKLQGQSDESRLTFKGEAQARKAGQELSRLIGSRQVELWSSGLARAHKTAEIAAKELGYTGVIQSDARLKEANHGRFEGLLKEEYRNDLSHQRWKQLSPEERFYAPMDDQEGESHDKVVARAKAALEEIAEQNAGAVKVIFTHGGLIKALQKDLMQKFDLPDVENGEIVVITYDGEKFAIQESYK